MDDEYIYMYMYAFISYCVGQIGVLVGQVFGYWKESLNDTLLAESVSIIFQHSILKFFVKRHACTYMCRPTV